MSRSRSPVPRGSDAEDVPEVSEAEVVSGGELWELFRDDMHISGQQEVLESTITRLQEFGITTRSQLEEADDEFVKTLFPMGSHLRENLVMKKVVKHFGQTSDPMQLGLKALAQVADRMATVTTKLT